MTEWPKRRQQWNKEFRLDLRAWLDSVGHEYAGDEPAGPLREAYLAQGGIPCSEEIFQKTLFWLRENRPLLPGELDRMPKLDP